MRRKLFDVADFLRRWNQNPLTLALADRIEHTAEHGSHNDLIVATNAVLEGIGKIPYYPK